MLFAMVNVVIDNFMILFSWLIVAFFVLMSISTLTDHKISFGEFGIVRMDDETEDDETIYTSNVNNTSDIIRNMYGHDIAPLNHIHYIAGSTSTGNGQGTIRVGQMFDFYYYGRDYVSSCGANVYAPFDSTLTYQSNIGGGTPQLTFTSLDGSIKVHTMHLDVVKTNGVVSQGTLVGYVDKKGAYSGGVCHGHDSLYVNGYLQDIDIYELKQGLNQ